MAQTASATITIVTRVQTLADRETFEARITDGAGHQGRKRQHQGKPSDRPAPIVEGVFPKMNGGGDHPCGSGARHAHEILQAARRHAMHVEARQAPRTADDKGQAYQPGKLRDVARLRQIAREQGLHAPGKRQNGGRNAETDNVGEGVKLFAEFGVGVGGARHEAVKRVKKNRKADGPRGIVQVRGAAFERGQTA